MQLIGNGLPKFETSATSLLVTDLDAPLQHHLLNIAVAGAKAKTEPNTVANDEVGKAVAIVWE